MAHRPRSEMIAETRAKLLAAARHAFGTKGYAEASMDDFTAEAGLTRGALYHHFGDKKGLLRAVIAEIDAEMNVRLREVSGRADTPWQAFSDECIAYLEMALEPEIRRIVLRDGPSVLGDPSTWGSQSECIALMAGSLRRAGRGRRDRSGRSGDHGAAAQRRDAACRPVDRQRPDPEAAARHSVKAFGALLSGLLKQRLAGRAPR